MIKGKNPLFLNGFNLPLPTSTSPACTVFDHLCPVQEVRAGHRRQPHAPEQQKIRGESKQELAAFAVHVLCLLPKENTMIKKQE